MHSHTLAPLDNARSLVEREAEELDAERAAFEAFGERVAAVDVQRRPAMTQSVSQSLVAAGPRTPASDRIRSAFRETVIAVPHYEEVYDEPLLVHVEGELGPDIAVGLDGNGALLPAFKRVVLETVGRAVDRRTTVLDQLETEAESLSTARSEFGAVAAALSDRSSGDDEASSPEHPLAVAKWRFTVVVEERQALIQHRHILVRIDGHDFCSYLYGDQAWTYPVLSVAASLQQDLVAVDRQMSRLDAVY